MLDQLCGLESSEVGEQVEKMPLLLLQEHRPGVEVGEEQTRAGICLLSVPAVPSVPPWPWTRVYMAPYESRSLCLHRTRLAAGVGLPVEIPPPACQAVPRAAAWQSQQEEVVLLVSRP